MIAQGEQSSLFVKSISEKKKKFYKMDLGTGADKTIKLTKFLPTVPVFIGKARAWANITKLFTAVIYKYS
jgi:hypothetical protein